MKRIVFLMAFCLSLSAIYAQTIDVIHLKSGFDARGTITNRTESQITLQTENGQTLTIDTSEIESMEQEQQAFDPRVLIGRWACYRASGERDERYDMEISENEGYYTVKYIQIIHFNSDNNTIKNYPKYTPDGFGKNDKDLKDIDVENGKVSYHLYQTESCLYNRGRRDEATFMMVFHCDIDVVYKDDKLRGSINCSNHSVWVSYNNYDKEKTLEDGPLGKWNVYFVKY